MKQRCRAIVVATGIAFLSYPAAGLAERAKPALEPGMSMGEVITRWGEPIDKIEHESRRTMVFQYPLGKVIFQQGRLVVYPAAATVLSDGAPVAVESRTSRRVRPEPPAEFPLLKGKAHDDLISEVLKEVPSDDEKGGASRGGPPTGGPSIIRPLPGVVPPPAMADDPEVD